MRANFFRDVPNLYIILEDDFSVTKTATHNIIYKRFMNYFVNMFQVQDAQATMRLFMLIREKWEKWMKEKGFIKKYKKDKQVELVKKDRNKKKQKL